jgi:hypothetical protein
MIMSKRQGAKNIPIEALAIQHQMAMTMAAPTR